VFVCVCVCVREREWADKFTSAVGEWGCACVCVCVCERERVSEWVSEWVRVRLKELNQSPSFLRRLVMLWKWGQTYSKTFPTIQQIDNVNYVTQIKLYCKVVCNDWECFNGTSECLKIKMLSRIFHLKTCWQWKR